MQEDIVGLDGYDYALITEDSLGMVLRGHLYVDRFLGGLIHAVLRNPDELDTARLRFETKVRLGYALGVLDPTRRRAYLFLNKLRNTLAHEVRATVGPDDERRFQVVLPPDLLHDVDDLVATRRAEGGEAEGEFPATLNAILWHLAMELHLDYLYLLDTGENRYETGARARRAL